MRKIWVLLFILLIDAWIFKNSFPETTTVIFNKETSLTAVFSKLTNPQINELKSEPILQVSESQTEVVWAEQPENIQFIENEVSNNQQKMFDEELVVCFGTREEIGKVATEKMYEEVGHLEMMPENPQNFVKACEFEGREDSPFANTCLTKRKNCYFTSNVPQANDLIYFMQSGSNIVAYLKERDEGEAYNQNPLDPTIKEESYWEEKEAEFDILMKEPSAE